MLGSFAMDFIVGAKGDVFLSEINLRMGGTTHPFLMVRMASQGRYDEATRLLLQRSVGQIAQARPDLVEPSSTAREIAAQPSLPANARSAFAVIADRVERSLFALRHLSEDDWQAARAAYADFALAQKGLRA